MLSLKDIMSKPVAIENLRKLLPKNSSAVLYSTLARDNKSRSEIFKNNKTLVVLYEGIIDGKKQGHFILLIPRAHSIEYFSSLGRSPADELNSLHENPNAFRKLLGKNYTYNRKKLQLDSYTVEDCAYWCIARAILWKIKISEFNKLFQAKCLKSSDEILANMCLLLANNL
jgi:hypothetical protein